MELNIQTQTTIAQNRAILSVMGSSLGKQIYQVSPRESFPDHAKKVAAIAAAGNVELTVNRTPMRYHMFGIDVANVSVEENVANQTVLLINKKDDGTADITLPISNDMTKYSDVTKDAIKQAIKGDKTKVFANPAKLAMFLNEINRAEISRIEKLIEALEKAKQGIKSAIAENEKKSADYDREIADSTPKVDLTVNTDSGVQVNISTDNE
jgi:predicted DNA-binding protein YlxM (UPF0122 family)